MRNRLLDLIDSEFTETSLSDKTSLRMLLLGLEANEALTLHDLKRSEKIHMKILEFLQSIRKSTSEKKETKRIDTRIGVAYHQLGRIEEERRRFKEAENWYKKALEVRERFGDKLKAAVAYHQLGVVAQRRGRFKEAENWYKKALEVRERFGDKLKAKIVKKSLERVRGKLKT